AADVRVHEGHRLPQAFEPCLRAQQVMVLAAQLYELHGFAGARELLLHVPRLVEMRVRDVLLRLPAPLAAACQQVVEPEAKTVTLSPVGCFAPALSCRSDPEWHEASWPPPGRKHRQAATHPSWRSSACEPNTAGCAPRCRSPCGCARIAR